MKLKMATRRAWIGVVALFAAGCSLEGGVTDPGAENPIEVTLDFCSNDIPVWFAHQSSNGPWEVITPNAAGTYTFTATNRAAVAFVHQDGADYKTDMIFTSNLDLQALSGLTCVEEGGAKQVNGNVSGLIGSELALVGMSFSSVYLTAVQTAFTLTQLVDRPVDLIASRIDVNGAQQHANKTVIRRNQTPASGSTMASINFDAEGVVPGFEAVNLNGVGSGDAAFLYNNFFSSLETSHTLSFVDGVSNGFMPFVALPASQLVAGDYHDLFVVAAQANGRSRGIERFYRNPSSLALTLGPPLAEPQVILVTTNPRPRLRVLLAGQIDYSTMITTDFSQQSTFSTIDLSMSVTASYFGGTPIEWSIQVPSLTGITGWQDAWELKSGNISWTVTGYFGRPQLLFGAKPDTLETVVFASASSSLAAAQAHRVGRATPLPRYFPRLR